MERNNQHEFYSLVKAYRAAYPAYKHKPTEAKKIVIACILKEKITAFFMSDRGLEVKNLVFVFCLPLWRVSCILLLYFISKKVLTN